MDSLIASLQTFLPDEDLMQDEPMSQHTTFRAGGRARLFVRLRYHDDLYDALEALAASSVPYTVIGNGSNLLVSDSGYDGVILCLTKSAKKKTTDAGEDLAGITLLHEEAFSEDDEKDTPAQYVYAGAAAMNTEIAAFAKTNALSGYEFAAGIPGTLGGAIVMNAGAYDGEMKDVVQWADALRVDASLSDTSVTECTFQKDALHFGYRTSALRNAALPTVLTGAVLRLSFGDADAIAMKMKELSLKRKEKQPLEYASAGSTFKRPKGHFAGALIEEAGCKGLSVGDAAVSDKHCGFLINKGNATASDVYALMKEVEKRVYANSGVQLEPEVIFLGTF